MRVPWLLLLCSSTALAHPMGRDEYSLRAGVEANKTGVRIVIMGEIPVPAVIEGLGKEAQGKRPTPAQVKAYTEARQQELMAAQTVTVDGEPMALAWEPSPSALNGRAIDGFFVYVVQTQIPVGKLDNDVTVVLDDQAWLTAPMVYDAEVRARAPWTLGEHSGPKDWTADASARQLTVRFTR